MNIQDRLVRSAIAFVSSYEGGTKEGELAFNATSVVAVVWLLFAKATFSFAALFLPGIARAGVEDGKWMVLVAAISIWLILFPSVRRTTKSILDGRSLRTSKWFAVWSMAAGACAFFVSIVATVAAR